MLYHSRQSKLSKKVLDLATYRNQLVLLPFFVCTMYHPERVKVHVRHSNARKIMMYDTKWQGMHCNNYDLVLQLTYFYSSRKLGLKKHYCFRMVSLQRLAITLPSLAASFLLQKAITFHALNSSREYITLSQWRWRCCCFFP